MMGAILGPGGLAGFGDEAAQEATQAGGTAAQLETNRELENARIAASNKASATKIGGAVGTLAGSAFGPVGSMVGATAGGMIGGMF